MVEYTVETLVHLYDSLNIQIESANNDLNDFSHIGFAPNLADWYKEQIENTQKKIEKRLDMLVDMRNNVEKILYSILSEEVKGL